MYSELSSIKLKAQRSGKAGSHLATYQGEVIRKSICNDPAKVPPLSRRKTKTRSVSSPKPARNAIASAAK